MENGGEEEWLNHLELMEDLAAAEGTMGSFSLPERVFHGKSVDVWGWIMRRIQCHLNF